MSALIARPSRRVARTVALAITSLGAAHAAAPQAGGISFGPAPTPHVGPLPVSPGGYALGGGCAGDCTVVDFESIPDQQPVGTITGPINVTFGPNWLGLVDADAGGSGNIANEPSPDTVAFVSSGAPTPIDFSTGVNFIEIFYVAGSTSIPLTLTAWDGPGGTGNIVATAVGDVVGNDGTAPGDPSGIFALWDAVTLTASGNLIRSVTLAGAASNQFGFDSMTFCTSGDTDQDGLLDSWETCGIDFNGDGTVDLDLPAMGADPTRPDVFVEIDAMSGRAPSSADLARVEAAFAAEGVTLHTMLDETSSANAAWPGGWTDFDAFKAAHFGTAADRASGNAANIINARRQATHYCVFADTHSGGTSSGLAEVGGNDFFATLGGAGWNDTADERCGMFMHLLGHNLGLRDGGSDDVAFKPNYPSVMNPTWTLPRTHNAGRWQLDYSSGVLNGINETMLDEAAGIGGMLNQVAFVGPAFMAIIVTVDAIDWNRDGMTSGTQALDVNQLNGSVMPSAGETYSDTNDWALLNFEFRNSPDFSVGQHATSADAEIDATLNGSLNGTCPQPTTYCGGTPNSLGITATMSAAGAPTLTGTDDFEVVASNALGGTFGVLIVSLGEDRAAFAGGTLCVAQPFTRVALAASGGTLGSSDGELRGSIGQSRMASQGWSAGTVVYAQWLNRDFGLGSNIGSTPGLVFVVCP